MRTLPYLIILFVLAVGAASCTENVGGMCRPERAWQLPSRYPIHATRMTPSGVSVDPTGQPVDLELIDQLTDEVEACLARTFTSTDDGRLEIPERIRAAASCSPASIPMQDDRECLTVKIPDDWTLSCYGDQQLLPIRAGDAGCLDKGRVPTEACPCRWRAGLQDGNVIVTTPSFYVYKDAYVRRRTGCAYPWSSPELAECMKPSTDPLYQARDELHP